MTPIDSTFIRRVVLRNYRSIGGCDVTLGPLTFLVGGNGAGKSNFLDALRLIADALRSSLDHALRERGGIHEVRRRSAGHPTHFSVRVEFQIPQGAAGRLVFEVGALKDGGFEVTKEQCVVGDASYSVARGEVKTTARVAPPASLDRLYLVAAAGLPEFRPAFDALSKMGFYNLNPDQIRAPQQPDKGEVLARDGWNLASVLERLGKTNASAKGRIEEYLSHVVPGIEGVETRHLGPLETLEFRQKVAGQKDAWRFSAHNMSDGTLRALGTLVALFQAARPGDVSLVGIEEPEIALHPAALGLLLDSLVEASDSTQVIVTSHSPDLLDSKVIREGQLLSVVAREGQTEIAAIGEAGASALRDHLYTAGELLRMDQLRSDESLRPPRQLELFEPLLGSP